MRIALPILVLALLPAAAAFGQSTTDLEFQVQQRFDQQRAVALENRLNTLEAKVQTEQRIGDLQSQRALLAFGKADAKPRATESGMAGYASIPDAALAASNARVREASQNKR